MPDLWLRVATVFYGCSLLLALAVLYRRESLTRLVLPVAAIGAIFHFVALAEAAFVSGYLAAAVREHSQSALAFLLMFFFFGIYARYRTISHGVFVFPLVFVLTLSAALAHEPPQFSSPLLRSGWIFLHIALISAGYAALFFSFASSILYLLQERSLKSKGADGLLGRLPSLAVMDDIGLRSLILGFPFMTLGLIAGSVVAQDVFGAAYFRDPKVVLSLLMWGVYILLLFTRWSAGWRGRKAAMLSAVAFISATLAWAANYVHIAGRVVQR
jgi:ABC-type uncharacterized transport system permease subunit